MVRLGEGDAHGLSPDGKWVSAKAEGSEILTLLPTGPGEPRPLSFPGLEGIFALFPRWFPDSRHLVVSAKRGKEDRRCFLVDLEGGVPRPRDPRGNANREGLRLLAEPGRKMGDRAAKGMTRSSSIPSARVSRVESAASSPNDRMVRWSADSRSLYIQTMNPEWPIRVFRFDVETGRREPWKELVPSDAAGVDAPQGHLGPDHPRREVLCVQLQAHSFGALRRGSSAIARART